MERAILTPLNVKVDEINFGIQTTSQATGRTVFSIDKCMNKDEATSYPVEFLNTLNPNGIPAHRLEFKVGSPIMLLRNLYPPKLYNGSRLAVKSLNAYMIEATILTGPFGGEHVFILRIPLIPTDQPLSFKRLHFPVRLDFAITINKSQRQSPEITGLDLTDECFSHGQLYVGTSRAKDPTKLYIVAIEEKQKILYTIKF